MNGFEIHYAPESNVSIFVNQCHLDDFWIASIMKCLPSGPSKIVHYSIAGYPDD